MKVLSLGLLAGVATARLSGVAEPPKSELELKLWEKELLLREREIAVKEAQLAQGGCSGVHGCTAEGDFDTLIFSDDFDTLDFEKWEHEITMGGGGNWEFEYYSNNRTNSFVRDGVLYLKPTFTSDTIGEENLLGNNYMMDLWGSSPADACTGNAFYGCTRTAGAGGNSINPIQSARLRSVKSMSMTYGRVEIRAKLPRGDWIWPALWMVPRNQEYGVWPASGEIDIMESRGNARGYSAGGCEAYGSTLHWGPHYPEDPYDQTHGEYSLPSGDFADDFHTFGLFWNSSFIYTYLDTDDNRVMEVPITESFWTKGGWDNTTTTNPWANAGQDAPFDRSFFLVMNVAVGGTNTYFPDTSEKPWTTTDAHAVNTFWNARGQWQPTWKGDDVAMKVDWVKVWQ